MKLDFILPAFICLLLPTFVVAEPEDPAKTAALKKEAQLFLDALVKEDYTAATKNFNKTMQKALPQDKLEELWKDLTKKSGAFKKQIGVRSDRLGKYDIILITCQFENAALDVKIVFDGDKKITGLFFLPPPSEYKPPAYVKRDAFRESEVTIGTGDWKLPGSLTLPTGAGPFPAVLLLHGSGPNDRDETILSNKPFRDLAWGLSSQGIAVLRYDKRTKVHKDKMVMLEKTLTVKEEVIDDALAAITFLRNHKNIDEKRIFILGHSLGGAIAPRIAAQDGHIAGLVILAGACRPIEDLILEQFTYIYSLDGPISDEHKADLAELKEQVARVKDEKLTKGTPATELPLKTPASYWLDLRAHPTIESAKKIKVPMLILQGERDYQVTMKDFAGWKKALGDRKNVTLKSFPALNHLFMEGEGKSKPEEYQKPGHVSELVVEEIGQWVKRQ